MGILDLLEEGAGAIAGVEAAKKLDPGASLLTEGLAAVAGFEGVKKLKEHFGHAQDTGGNGEEEEIQNGTATSGE